MTLDTCPRDEYLFIQPEILELAKKSLSPEKLLVANQVSLDLISSKAKKEKARLILRRLVGVQPSRPLFYANTHLRHLPRFTRDPIRYVGDYVDHLVKFWSSEIIGKAHLTKSMGVNLNSLKGKIDEGLREKLVLYNNLCYVPAKHDFKLKGRNHRFSSKEAVFICFITMELGNEIMKRSPSGKDYAAGNVDDNWAEMKYNHENIDSLAT